MDSRQRRLVKAVTWQALGIVTMTLIGLIMTGSLQAGGSFALISSAVGFVCYFFHECLWDRVAWGRSRQRSPAPANRTQG